MLKKYKWPILILLAVLIVVIVSFFFSELLGGLLGLGAFTFFGAKGVDALKKDNERLNAQIRKVDNEVLEHEKIIAAMGADAILSEAKRVRAKRKKS